ncbi:Glucosamine-6-phosphate isomerase (Glucosamine-6-phosphate deaminase) (GNPDA) (GlcN6P deaminase) [Rachicladosporium monterosium]|uniref:beta-N-acetylhexosaminidase n=1 Tax=Rachicladosporium monterosium TaxID=1507873 RepID=A0ABR0LCX3_9PEZI|nr:Glucosamine-6-phosphate isomerase (Glucosamine-6-phosphate deaminase) (GNPDA) (GlcN6P deaminase) [Rachicladosporium monterosium]
MSDFEPSLTSNSTYVKSITLQQTASDPANIMKPTAGGVDESYSLTMTTSGDVAITAASSIGLAHGLTTFTQLFFECSSGGGVYTTLAPVSITDAPKFEWRGLNIDTSRTFKPMSDMYAMIDALAYNKMNRLHWHVTDAQAWPLVIPSMPALADKGAYASFQKYAPADVQALQEYGALLGIEVVMEIDQPGHTSSIAFAYPDLIAAFNVQPNWDSYASEPPSGTLKLNSTAVYDFLEKLFDDILPRLKPLTNYFHLGGDEVNVNAYTLDDTVGTNDTAVLQPLMQKFMDRNIAQLQANGFTPLVWEEMLLVWNLTLPANTIVQTWLSDQSVAETVAKGHKALAGNYNFWYLDCGQGQWLDFRPAVSASFWPYADYCSPRHNWRLMYSYDPLSGVPANLTHLVLGVALRRQHATLEESLRQLFAEKDDFRFHQSLTLMTSRYFFGSDVALDIVFGIGMLALDAALPCEGAVRFHDLVVRYACFPLQAVYVLREQLQQQAFVVQQPDEGVSDRWSVLARIQLVRQGVERLGVLFEEADIEHCLGVW